MSNSPSSPNSKNPIPRGYHEQDLSQVVSPEELAEQRSQWLSRLLSENPQILALRERVLPWTGGFSFANVVHTDTIASLSHVNRHVIMELIYQHLHAIGMHHTAETLQEESGHEFQKSDQQWDKTDLLLLVSLGILPREDPWIITPDIHHQFVEENLEEDFFASPYREDPSELWKELLDDSINVVYSSETDKSFSKLKAASLRRIAVLLVTSPVEQFPNRDKDKFFLTLHSITTSHHFFEHLLALFNCDNLEPPTEEQKKLIMEKQSALRMGVINSIRVWIKLHGLFIGRKTLKAFGQFFRSICDDPKLNESLDKYAKPYLAKLQNLKYGMEEGSANTQCPKPHIPDPQIIFRPNLKITDPSPIEVARQITLLFHTSFRAVHSREFVVALGEQKPSHQTPTLSEFFEFGERLTLLILETIVTSSDRTLTISKIVEIATQLHEIGNFDALACILRALKKDEVINQMSVSNQALSIINSLWTKSGEDNGSFNEYRVEVMNKYSSWNHMIPNLRIELKSTQIDKSPSFINGLINWEKRKAIADEADLLYRFQNRPYSFTPIPQIQSIVTKGSLLTESQVQEKIDQIVRSKFLQ